MNDKLENPPAFPSNNKIEGKGYPVGMTLRDYFASATLQAVLGNEFIQRGFQADNDKSIRYVERLTGEKVENFKGNAEYIQQLHAGIAYQFADAMLKARQTNNKGDL